MRILIIDNTMDRESWGSGDLRKLAASGGATVCVRRAPQGDLPRAPSDFDRIILSGSRTSANEEAPWISELQDFVRTALNESKHVLGVCYGHQVLANVLENRNTCHRAETPEFGWAKIELTDDAPLFNALPREFYSFAAHFEEVQSLPRGTRALARSEACAIQAFQLENRPVYGIQFHPERDLEGAKHSFDERRKAKSPKTLLHPNRSAELYDPKIGETIFRNFLEG